MVVNYDLSKLVDKSTLPYSTIDIPLILLVVNIPLLGSSLLHNGRKIGLLLRWSDELI